MTKAKDLGDWALGISSLPVTINRSVGVGIGTTNPTSTLDITGDFKVGTGITINSGIITATGGFISGVGQTSAVQIEFIGNQLTFTVSGIGSTTLTLS